MANTLTPREPSSYRYPPIAEAVIEIRFEQKIAPDRVEQAAQRIKANYTFIEPENAIEFQFDAEKQQASFSSQFEGFRLNSLNRDETAMVRSNAYVCARLAPYTGWADLEGRAKRDWEIWKRVVGYSKISRIGIRYINRIDVLQIGDASVRIENYLNVYPTIPEGAFEPLTNYAMQATTSMPGSDFKINLNSGSVPSPLVDHVSFALDIDLFCDVNLPQRDEEIWPLVAEMRDCKNRAFESCITDRSRGMFQR